MSCLTYRIKLQQPIAALYPYPNTSNCIYYLTYEYIHIITFRLSSIESKGITYAFQIVSLNCTFQMCEGRDMAQLIIKRPNEVQDIKLEMNKPK